MKKILENLIEAGLLQEERGIGFDQIIKRLERAGNGFEQFFAYFA